MKIYISKHNSFSNSKEINKAMLVSLYQEGLCKKYHNPIANRSIVDCLKIKESLLKIYFERKEVFGEKIELIFYTYLTE